MTTDQARSSNLPLVPTKFFAPRSSTSWIARPRLIAQLDAASDARLILLSAAAGFGKTVLASQWLEHLAAQADSAIQSSWLSLDTSDDTPVRFLRYLAAAIDRAFVETCTETQALLQKLEPPPLPVLIETLIGELAALERPVLLVLDDFHVITDAAIQRALQALIERMPDTLRLLITTRNDPPWPLARWRVRGQVLELRDQQLRFTPAEARAFVAETLRLPLDALTSQLLHERTEGWAAGLQLAGLSLKQSSDPVQRVHTLRGTDRHVMDYLLDEVLAGQAPPIQHFLFLSALVERFSAELCAELAREAGLELDVRASLLHLERFNLFLVPLDDQRVWYRYHQMFRDLLLFRVQQHWNAELLQRLYQRAGHWCIARELFDEAIRYLLAGDAAEVAAELLERQLHPSLDDIRRLRALSEGLALIPEQVVQQRAGLLVARAYLQFHLWDPLPVPALLRRARLLLEQAPPPDANWRDSLSGDIAAIEAWIALMNSDLAAAQAAGSQALALIPATHRFARGMAVVYTAASIQLSGALDEGLRIITHAQAEAAPDDLPYQGWLLTALFSTYYLLGNLTLAGALAGQLVDKIAGTPFAMQYINATHMLGLIHYERNELEQAERYFSIVADSRYRTQVRVPLDSLYGLACISLARGNPEAARAYAAEAREFVQGTRSLYCEQIADAFEAWLARRLGQRDSSAPLSAQTRIALSGAEPWLVIGPWLQLQLLVEDSLPASRALAEPVIAETLHAARLVGNQRLMLTLLSLQALLAAANHDQPTALAVLSQAIKLAAPAGYLRSFADLSPGLLPLLQALARSGVEPAYIGRILAAFPANRPLPAPAPGQRLPADLAAQVLLTEREHEVLTLLAGHLTDTEIAARMFIAPSTVKTHIGNILGKLEVRNRRAAVSRAREMGILPP